MLVLAPERVSARVPVLVRVPVFALERVPVLVRVPVFALERVPVLVRVPVFVLERVLVPVFVLERVLVPVLVVVPVRALDRVVVVGQGWGWLGRSGELVCLGGWTRPQIRSIGVGAGQRVAGAVC